MARDGGALAAPPSLGDRLLEAGVITRTQLDAALDHQAGGPGRGQRLGPILVQLGVLTDHALIEILSVHLGIPVAPFSLAEAEPRALSSVPAALARRHRALPCRVVEGTLALVVADAPAPGVLREIEAASGYPAVPYLASEDELAAALETHYGAESRVIARLRDLVGGLQRLGEHRERLAGRLPAEDEAGLVAELEALRRDLAAVAGACEEISAV